MTLLFAGLAAWPVIALLQVITSLEQSSAILKQPTPSSGHPLCWRRLLRSALFFPIQAFSDLTSIALINTQKRRVLRESTRTRREGIAYAL